MQAESSIELGPDAPALEIPWSSPDGSVRFLDLRVRPELLLELPEAVQNRDLARFLTALNGERSHLQTAKCDVWITNELGEDEGVFEAEWKFGSYVDVVLTAPEEQADFALHEGIAGKLAKLLRKAPELSAAAEFVVRRCYFHRSMAEPDRSDDGFCITMFLNGYGDDESQARQRWVIGMELLQNAVAQVMHAVFAK
jgi:hypothetical protein